MKTISLCMIVKNEEDVLENCLSSVFKATDEIIIVDTGSTDKTKDIARKYTDKIYDFKWVDDFSKARNYSFSKATKDYILWLDADDIIEEEDLKKLIKLKEEINEEKDAYSMLYIYSRDENGKPTYIQEKNRLVKRKKNYKWERAIHEYLKISGNIEKTDIKIIHNKKEMKDPERNLRIYRKLAKETELDERDGYLYASTLKAHHKKEEAIKEYETYIKKYIDNYDKNNYYMYKALIELSQLYKETSNNKEIEILLTILKYQKPTIDLLNRISDYLLRNKKYKEAVFWLKIAISIDDETYNQEYDKFISYIKLGYCYYYLKDYKKAYKYNELAGKYSNNNKTYKENRSIYLKYLTGGK